VPPKASATAGTTYPEASLYVKVNCALACDSVLSTVEELDITISAITAPMTTGTTRVAIQKPAFDSVRFTSKETMVRMLCRAIAYTSPGSSWPP
jgi:hypothetical protein